MYNKSRTRKEETTVKNLIKVKADMNFYSFYLLLQPTPPFFFIPQNHFHHCVIRVILKIPKVN